MKKLNRVGFYFLPKFFYRFFLLRQAQRIFFFNFKKLGFVFFEFFGFRVYNIVEFLLDNDIPYRVFNFQ